MHLPINILIRPPAILIHDHSDTNLTHPLIHPPIRPVGSGKTALMLQLAQRLSSASYSIACVTNDIFTQEDAEFLIRNRALDDPARIRAIETGGCPHAAIREDIAANLNALEELHQRFHTQLLLIESGACVRAFVRSLCGGVCVIHSLSPPPSPRFDDMTI